MSIDVTLRGKGKVFRVLHAKVLEVDGALFGASRACVSPVSAVLSVVVNACSSLSNAQESCT